jgi:hypothetical protein
MWSFNDTSLLHVPRGIVVDSDGFVFVTGKKTGNIVVISPDGNSAQELIGFGLHVELSNSFLLVIVIKFTITVSNSITMIFVFNFVQHVLRVNILCQRKRETSTNRTTPNEKNKR